MSYFPEDIPFMSKEELRENGIRIPKDTTDTNVGDTISRQQAIDALQNCRKHCIDPFDSYHIDIQDAENQLSKVPTIQPEPKEGEWIPVQRHEGDTQPDLECPFCKHRIGWFDMGRYCAGCGAKLKGGAG